MKSLLLVLLVAACGDDAPPPAKGPEGAPPPGAPKPDDKNKLQPRRHVEDNVVCPVPDKPTGPACKPEAATCDPGRFCIQQVGGGYNCEPCPERDSIRHDFRDRDFVADQVRDPFQSFIIVQKGLEPAPNKHPEAGPCNRADQFVASNYSYLELKLVGIVTKGTQRKALMIGGNAGYFVRRGDCVGKEKALVKDIGGGFVTFVVQPDADERGMARAAEERSLQLHPTQLQVAPQPQFEAPGSTAPVVTPNAPAAGAPQPQPAPAPAPPPPVVTPKR